MTKENIHRRLDQMLEHGYEDRSLCWMYLEDLVGAMRVVLQATEEGPTLDRVGYVMKAEEEAL